MSENNFLAEGFEANRSHLQAVAYRMLGSRSEAEDAVQEAWLRLSRADRDDVANLGGWLTTVVARICLDILRARRSRREEPLEVEAAEQTPAMAAGTDPEREAALADSVGVALLVVLQMLAPAERVAFVLHDMFDLPFEEIGPIVGRTPIAARQLASRARRRVHGGATLPAGELARQRGVVDAYLAASRAGDFEGLLAVLDPDVVLHADRAVLPAGASQESRTAPLVARRALAGRAGFAQAALINGSVGVVVARRGRLHLVLSFVFGGGRITGIDVIGDAERLAALDIKVFG